MVYDVAIIGSGIAGLTAALTLARHNKRVVIITKKRLISSATNYAQGGIAAVLSTIDSAKKHVADTLVAGAHHNNVAAVTYMAEHGRDAVYWLLEYGVPFATLNGVLQLTREGGHSVRRIAYVGDYTGKAIEETLVRRCRKEKNITVFTDTFAVDLIKKNGACIGVEVANTQRKKTFSLFAHNTVIATGGAGQIFAHTTNPAISTGDGIAMALRIGARVKDMEFVQFHPTAFIYKGKTRFLLSEALRGEGALLINSQGEHFMKKYDGRKELAPRDIVARALFEEEKKGAIYLDLRHLDPKMVHARFPSISANLKKYGFDLARDLIPVSPAAHYLCGGVAVDLHGKTSVKNLYCFGEASYTGVHGANRLASNSLLEAVVFARAATQSLIKKKTTTTPTSTYPHRTLAPVTVADKRMLTSIDRRCKKLLWNTVGVVRTKKGLTEALTGISELESALALLPHSIRSIELANMLAVAKNITLAALKREESLGCHYRIN